MFGNHMKNCSTINYKHVLTALSVVGMVLFFTNPLYGQWPFNEKHDNQESDKFIPEKDWTKGQYQEFYRWREGILKKQMDDNDDPQLLRRQKAILNGNKITAEIWNYGSISSPGNRVTDIVWEGLGYGYEFGPFICAEVEVAPNSH
ncbi:uncharacterized protein METZ01_LOCUS216223, partial [marine metagenome]